MGVYQTVQMENVDTTQHKTILTGNGGIKKGFGILLGFAESPVDGLGIPCSIRLSYGGMGNF
jgi:hypothetical protein